MKSKRIFFVMLAALMVICAFTLTSCTDQPDDNGDNGGTPEPTHIDYTVTVKDAFGAPVSNIVVKLMQDGESVKMKMTGEDGTVSGTADIGEYEIALDYPDAKKFYYTPTVLSQENSNPTVTVYDLPGNNGSQELTFGFDYSGTQNSADVLIEGGYRVELSAGKNYFVFVPEQRGEYLISTDFDKNVNLSYHGGIFFVQENNIADEDASSEIVKSADGITFKIRSFNVGESIDSSTKYVISVECAEQTAGVIVIKRTGELEMSLEELPWQEAPVDPAPGKFTVPGSEEGIVSFKDFDITDSTLTWVYSETDGYYHLGDANGPVLYLKLNVASAYAPSIKEICETNGYGAYIYDADGKFVEKRSYASFVAAYTAAADEAYGVYPVTAPLYDFLINYGNQNGWWERSAELNRFFGDVAARMVAENAWLFAACYIPTEDTSAGE